jgi:hypothetical protein
MAAKKKTAPPPPSPPPAVRVGRLDTAGGVVKELGRVYRDARTGRLPSATATKLAYVLATIRTAIETGEMAARLDALENQTKETDHAAD